MKSQKPRAEKPVSHRKRNLCSLAIAGATIGFLCMNFNATPAGGSIEEKVNLDKVGGIIDLDVEQSESGGSAEKKNTLHGKTALLMSVLMLERSVQSLSMVESYSATFYKQEVLKGNLAPSTVMQVKVRHKPFSVYMKWLKGDVGRELLYVDGEHEGDILVRLGGGGGFVPTLKLNPTGDKAMKEARYPVTNMGMLNLAKKILDYRRRDVQHKVNPKCVMLDNQLLADRKCYCFLIEYARPKDSSDYRKSIIFIDKELLVPVCIQNFGWGDRGSKSVAEFDKETMIEDYRYSNVRLNKSLTAADFDRNNKGYRLK